MLNELYLETLADQCFSEYEIDSYAKCVDKAKFLSYTKPVFYMFNDRGFRDDNWPNDIKSSIWCLGDSFTVGMGQPADETWPNIVQKQLARRSINVSMNGASNDWIARKGSSILSHTTPHALLIQWTYLHRREHPDVARNDEDRRLHYVKGTGLDVNKDQRDFENFIKNLNTLETLKHSTKIIHSFVPNFCDTAENEERIFDYLCTNNVQFFKPIQHIDYSRDGHHYDVKTASVYAENYCSLLNL